MQDIAQRRQASLDYYREQYDSGPSAPAPHHHRYADGEDEIDSSAAAVDDVDSVQNSLTRTNIARPTEDQL